MQKQTIKLVERIYKAPIIEESILEDLGLTLVTIEYNNKLYTGMASLHYEDRDYFSKVIGKKIAISKARTKILRHEVARLKEIIKVKKQFLFEVTHYNMGEESPLKARMERNIRHCEHRLDLLNGAIDNEVGCLKVYLKDVDKALGSVKTLRKKQMKDNNK